MDKVKLEFKIPKTKTIEYNNTEIKIIPYFTISQQVALIIGYIETYFEKSEDAPIELSKYDYVGAELNLIQNMFLLNTNIDVENTDSSAIFDETLVYGVTSEITNYYNFREKLDRVILDIKEQRVLENSIGTVVSNLVEKAYVILNKISNISPEEIEKAQKEGIKLIERLEKSSVLGEGSLLSETPKVKKTRKKKTE